MPVEIAKSNRGLPAQAPSPLAPLGDAGAELYFGDLAAAAEITLPGAPREHHLALTWVVAHVAHARTRLWTAKMEDVIVEAQPLGCWKVTARTEVARPRTIELARRSWLREDGRQVMALAQSFRESPDDGIVSETAALDHLLGFCAVQVIVAAVRPLTISDALGTKVTLRAERSARLRHALRSATTRLGRITK